MQQHKAARISYLSKTTVLAFMFLSGIGPAAFTQQDGASHPEEIGIIVTSTEAEAAGVLKQLNAGWDFSVLAKEKSIDSTANDGGYMGSLNVDQLRPEFRDALAGHPKGQVSGIVPTSSGFAILKILSSVPPQADLNLDNISAMIASGAIRQGPSIGGFTESISVFQKFQKPEGWNRDLKQSCSLRNQSYEYAIDRLTRLLVAAEAGNSGTYSPNEIMKLHAYRGQLYSFEGKMAEAIKDLKTAYALAQKAAPDQAPQYEEDLGGAYLHLSEMENGVYSKTSEAGIFPPANHKASYEKKEESQLAIQYFTHFLTQFPNDLEVKWDLNLAYMTLGQYPDGVPKEYLVPEAGFQSKEDIGRFVDIAPSLGVSVMREAGGVIVDDFDNDGLLDIVTSSMGVCDPIKFFHNNGDGTFTDRTAAAGLANQIGALNAAQLDYNNDGCMDILIMRGGWEYPQKRSLMRNNCDGTFADVTEVSGLGDPVTGVSSVAVADIDNDGYIDLFFGNENQPSQLFHNKGDGTFEEISHSAGIDRSAFTKGVTAADYDQDGYADFYVSNFDGPNSLYHNNGNLTFTDVARLAGVQEPLISFPTWFFDYDNDGWPDIFVSSYFMSMTESAKTYLGLPRNAESVKLYRNKHDGTFEDVTSKVGLDKVFMTMGANFGDVDNDGYLDIYLGMGNPSYTALFPHTLLRNNEAKTFLDITASSGTGDLHKGHGISFADLDRSGNEAIIANFGGAVPGDSHYLRVFQNPGNKNDWINVHLVGVKSNRSGVGAQVKITVADDGQAPRTIYRTGGETSSFGANPLELHIGLGHGAQIQAIDVWWPATNTRQHFTGVEKNQYIEIKEFAAAVSKLNRPSYHMGGPAKAAAKELGKQP